jgi:negative regulator of sigma E activity
MTQRRPIEYVQFYTVGTAAKKVEVAKPKLAEPVFLPPIVHKRKKVYVDPVPVLGMLVAVCMLFTMLIGVNHLRQVRQDTEAMEQYVLHLQQVNDEKQELYHNSYSLEEIEKTAIALGMVPADQVLHQIIDVSEPPAQEEPSLFDSVGTFLSGLFA